MKKARIVHLLLISLALATPCLAQKEIAIINTDTFSDSQEGIALLVQALTRVDREFEGRRAQLNEIKERLDRLISPPLWIPTNPDRMSDELKRAVQAERLRRLYERESQNAEGAYNRRIKEATGPIFADISKSLEAFARRRRIKLLLDAGKMACTIPCDKQAIAKIDVTREFVDEYNRLHPRAEQSGK